jgi:tetratricopeptide (TPR) repeat protein
VCNAKCEDSVRTGRLALRSDKCPFENIEPALYHHLAGLALDLFKKGDHARAIQVGRSIDIMWDGSPTTKTIRERWPDKYKKIDHDMDVFLASLRSERADGSADRDAESSYQAYAEEISKLKWLSQILTDLIKVNGIDAAIEEYRRLQKNDFPDVLLSEDELNNLGYSLLAQGEKDGAIKIFKLNVRAYPKSANVYDSLGDAYASAGKKALAVEHYRLAFAIDPGLGSATKLEELEEQ